MTSLYGGDLQSAKDYYEAEEHVQEEIVELLERDAEEGVPQYVRIFCAAMGFRAILDRDDRTRWEGYQAHPPIDGLTFMAPPDIVGRLPYWSTMAAEMPKRWNEYVQDFIRLNQKYGQKGSAG